MGPQDLAMVSSESTRSLLGVYPQSTWSLPGVYLESTRSGVTPPKTELETFIFALGFGHRFWTIFGPKLTPNGHPKWTKIDEKLHCILVPSPVPFFEPFFFKISPSSNSRMLIFSRFFQYILRMHLAICICTWFRFQVPKMTFFGPQNR